MILGLRDERHRREASAEGYDRAASMEPVRRQRASISQAEKKVGCDMKLSATRTLLTDETTWGAEPNLRADIKRQIAQEIAMKMRTRDLIDWSWQVTDDGELEVVGLVEVGNVAQLRAVLEKVIGYNKSLANDPEIRSALGIMDN